ncbi:MAG: hypothetical protein FWC70_01975 [Defluviitaleaceae bacterium]|nr:hypothetical protein [Defluviitaleaceae bacterium]
MKKMLLVPVLLLLFVACTPRPESELPTGGGNLPYRVWASWEEMKEVLGDHYLYPTYLPAVTALSERPSMRSWFNNVDRTLVADELFHEYLAVFPGNDRMSDEITISATDLERRRFVIPRSPDFPPVLVPFNGGFQEEHRFNEHIVTIDDINIEFVSFFAVFSPEGTFDRDEWFRYHPRNGRAVLYTFIIDTVTYEMSWVQFNVEDSHDDSEQREGMLRVATSIIEQVREVE